MKRRTRDALATTVLAAALWPAPAAPASQEILRALDGPTPAPGGVWLTHGERDGSLVALLIDGKGRVLREVVLWHPGYELRGAVRADGEGRLWVAARHAFDDVDDDGGWSRSHAFDVAVFGADGRLLASHPAEAFELFAVGAAGPAYLADHGEGRQVWILDPFTGRKTLLFEVSPTAALAGLEVGMTITVDGEAGPSLTQADDGAAFVLETGLVVAGRSFHLLRRFTPGGVETNVWRLDDHGESLGLWPLADDAVALAGWRDGRVVLTVVGADGPRARHRLDRGGPVVGMAPLADGRVLLRLGDEALLLDAEGREIGGFTLRATAWWVRDGEGRRRIERARREAAEGRLTALFDLLLLAAEDEREAAMRRLHAAGADAVEAALDWYGPAVFAPSGAAESGDVGADDREPELARAWWLADRVEELLAGDADAVGDRWTAYLPSLSPELRGPIASALVERWPHPSPAFLALLAGHLGEDEWDHDGDWLGLVAVQAFEEKGPPRFPATPEALAHYLDELSSRCGSPYTDPARFMATQLPVFVPGVLVVAAGGAGPAVVVPESPPAELPPTLAALPLLDLLAAPAGDGG